MSEKKPDGKRAARERLRQQRAREKAREKRRRTLFVVVAGVGVLGIAAAVGFAVNGSEDGTSGEARRAVATPKNATGRNNLVIPVGKPGAPSTLTIYEDFRCPACRQFEDAFRDTIRDLEKDGRLKVEYHLATIIDGNVGGTGSLRAANAAACAQDAGKFPEYHDVLFRNQPAEADDAFADNKRLVKLAEQVDGLVTDGFRKCVDGGEHDGWVEAANRAFLESGHEGTPTVLLDGENVYGDQRNPLTPDKLKQMVRKE
ncbi:DsbA family protein [Streptomyces sp. TP-A0874]|uniref:DsbA family protein n=1 Tax=Streptomyces sp. TP-A0874 TaxID=549819 RepID=UPI0008538FE1|nr:thioredoxin domain-containing protein [Streptomyces sp. TP-A0874]